jgi:hypothetical protein
MYVPGPGPSLTNMGELDEVQGKHDEEEDGDFDRPLRSASLRDASSVVAHPTPGADTSRHGSSSVDMLDEGEPAAVSDSPPPSDTSLQAFCASRLTFVFHFLSQAWQRSSTS